MEVLTDRIWWVLASAGGMGLRWDLLVRGIQIMDDWYVLPSPLH